MLLAAYPNSDRKMHRVELMPPSVITHVSGTFAPRCNIDVKIDVAK